MKKEACSNGERQEVTGEGEEGGREGGEIHQSITRH